MFLRYSLDNTGKGEMPGYKHISIIKANFHYSQDHINIHYQIMCNTIISTILLQTRILVFENLTKNKEFFI